LATLAITNFEFKKICETTVTKKFKIHEFLLLKYVLRVIVAES